MFPQPITSTASSVERTMDTKTMQKNANLGGSGGETEFEQAFSSLAYSYLRDKAPRLLDNMVGFQLVERNEDNTKAVGVFGINIHRATALEGKTSTYVNKWSAGCQVIASNDDWMEFLGICQEAREHWGNSFSYTLIESKDIVG